MEQESIKFLSPLTRKVSMEPKTLFHFVLSLKDTIKDFLLNRYLENISVQDLV